jgi:hypothetical protein
MSPDQDLEDRIAWALMQWQSAIGPTSMRRAYKEFRDLVAQRSPKKVAELEKAKGIHKDQQ